MRNIPVLSLALVLLLVQLSVLFGVEGNAPAETQTFEEIDNLRHERKWREIIGALGEGDLSTKAGELGKNLDRLYFLRGRAYYALKEGGAADHDLKKALESALEKDPMRQEYLALLADNYLNLLNDPVTALATYREAIDFCFELKNKLGTTPVQCTMNAAAILREDGKYPEALEVLQRYDDAMVASLLPVWRIRLLRAFSEVYLGQGQEASAQACLDKISALEANPGTAP